MNKTGLKIAGFVLGVVGAFVLIGQSVPQIGSYPPRPLDKESFAKLTPEQMVEKGRELFGKGGERCSQCHIVGEGTLGRCPNLAGVGARAGTRRPGYSAQDYILESMVEPKAFLVPGYGPIMPEVYKPPLDLSEYDILAVAAFLESLGGTVTMSNQFSLEKAKKPEWAQTVRAARAAGAGKAPPKGDIANGRRIFYLRARCVACHKTTVDGQKIGGVLGPDLSGIGGIQGPDYLHDKIMDPTSSTVSGYKKGVMETHWKENFTAQEIDDLVVFLLSLKGS